MRLDDIVLRWVLKRAHVLNEILKKVFTGMIRWWRKSTDYKLLNLFNEFPNFATSSLKISEENWIIWQAAMGKNARRSKENRKCHKVSTSQYKAQKRPDRCWSRAWLNIPKGKAKTNAPDSPLSLRVSLFFPPNLRTMVGEGNISKSLRATHHTLHASNDQLGYLLASRQKYKWQWKRWGKFCAIVWASHSHGALNVTMFSSFSNCRHFSDNITSFQQTAKQ